MIDLTIKKLEIKDIESVVDLWYTTSLIAHNFIPASYWEKNKKAMETEYLPNSETYVAIQDEKIVGFVAMLENSLAAIFVDKDVQGKGIGKLLLDFVKKERVSIQLKVFSKNKKSISFYENQDFTVLSESMDEQTGEKELLMEWFKNKK